MDPTPASPRHLRKLLLRVGLLFASSLLALFLFEAFLVHTNLFGILHFRETNGYIQHAIELLPEADRPDGRLFENRSGVDLELFNFHFRTGDQGLRSAVANLDPQADKEAGVPRVLFLGDSVTLAWGVDDETSWVRRLERNFAASGAPIECLNAGHLQYNTIQEADWFAAHAAKLRPDLVVVTFVVNDLDDAYGVYQGLKAALVAGATVTPTWLARRKAGLRASFPGLFALARLVELRREARGFRPEPVALSDFPEYAGRSTLARTAFDRILATCTMLGAELVVLDHSQPQLPVAEEWCRANGVRYGDLRFTATEWAEDIRNSLADAHANSLGNRYLADKAEPVLRATAQLGP